MSRTTMLAIAVALTSFVHRAPGAEAQQLVFASLFEAPAPQESESFGGVLASGDWDGDGRVDLLGGSQTRTVVSFGSGRVETLAVVVAAAASGDFDHDGIDDLVLGAATADGHLWVYYGKSDLFTFGRAGSSQSWSPADLGLPSGSELGASIAVADIDGDGYDDMVVGAPGVEIEDDPKMGGMILLGGGPNGVTPVVVGSKSDFTDAPHMGNERFGLAVAIGDFDGDGEGDIVVGSEANVGGAAAAGAVGVLLSGPAAARYLHQDTFGVAGTVQAGDRFGRALAIGDFDGDGYDDLAVGAPGDDGGWGMVHVLFGSSAGLTASGAQVREPENGEVWTEYDLGRALAAGDFDADGYDDLAVSSAYFSFLGFESTVWSFPGSPSGIGPRDYPRSFEVAPAGSEVFGIPLVAADLNRDDGRDLLIGFQSGMTDPEREGTGVAVLAFGAAIFRAGFEGGTTDEWTVAQ